jgi:hypothetical protein
VVVVHSDQSLETVWWCVRRAAVLHPSQVAPVWRNKEKPASEEGRVNSLVGGGG